MHSLAVGSDRLPALLVLPPVEPVENNSGAIMVFQDRDTFYFLLDNARQPAAGDSMRGQVQIMHLK